MNDRPGPRVLGIAGSPRVGGNSERLLDEALGAAKRSGASTTKVVIASLALMHCAGCGACSRTGECAIEDDMAGLIAHLDQANGLVVASPVYFASVPAPLKAFYDRLQPYWARRHILGGPALPRRSGGLLLVRGGGDPYGHVCATTVTRSALASLGVRVDEEYVLEGADAMGDVESRPDALAVARRVGARIAQRSAGG